MTPQEKFLGKSWAALLGDEFKKEYMKKLSAILKKERRNWTIRPPQEQTFRAYKLTPYEDVRVIILGQD